MKAQRLSTSGARCKCWGIICLEVYSGAEVALCSVICVSTYHYCGPKGDEFLLHAPLFMYSFSTFRILLLDSDLFAQII